MTAAYYTTREHDQRHHTAKMPSRKSAAWSRAEDERLMEERRRNTKWPAISKLFQGKTPNACRKRYERLIEDLSKTRVKDELSNEKLGSVYMKHREAFWKQLALELGVSHDQWETVESRAFAWGLGQLHIFDRRDRVKVESPTVAGLYGRSNTSPDTDDCESVLSDSTSGGLAAMLERAEMGTTNHGYPISKIAYSPYSQSNQRMANAGFPSTNHAYKTSMTAQDGQLHEQPYIPNVPENGMSSAGSYKNGRFHAVPSSRSGLRLPDPIYGPQTSCSPDLSQPQHKSSHFSRILHAPMVAYPTHYHSYTSSASSLPNANTLAKPGSIDSMLQGSSSSSPRFESPRSHQGTDTTR